MAAAKVVDPATITDGKKKAKKRMRSFTSNDRAAHQVIEKQRRVALNQRFLDLARLIPKLGPARRLSKSLIVRESADYLSTQRQMRLAAAAEVRELLADYDKVIEEVNNWRILYNPGGVILQQSRPVNKALLDLLKVDQERFGTFPEGFGDKGTGDEPEEDQVDMNDHDIPWDGDLEVSNDDRVPWDGEIEIPNASHLASFSGSHLDYPSSFSDGYDSMVSGDGLFYEQ